MSKITVPGAPGYSLLKRLPYKETVATSTPILAWQFDEATGKVSPITMTGVALIDKSDVLLPHNEAKPMEADVVILRTGEWINLEIYLNRENHDYMDDREVWPAFPDPCLQDGGGFTFDGRYDDHPAYLKSHAEFMRDPEIIEPQITLDDVGEMMTRVTNASSKTVAMTILKKVGGVKGLSKLHSKRFQAMMDALQLELTLNSTSKKAAAIRERKRKA